MNASSAAVNQVSSAAPSATDDAPWWRHAMVWVVIAGPLAVLVAGFVTLGIAWTHVDPVLADKPAAGTQAGSLAPAQQARNHAATPQR